MKNSLMFLILMAGVASAQASEIHYQVSTARPAQTMMKMSIPYTLGVHEGSANELRGTVVTDGADKVLRARFQVPIDAMTTGNSLRDCHMREALGIHYANSQFPKEHVCSGDNLIPTSGPDSVQYPNITVDFLNMTLPQDPYSIGLPHLTDVTVKVNIHGVTKIYNCDKVMITKVLNDNGAPGFRVVTKMQLSLKDFEIQIKPLKIGPVSINVKDMISVGIDIDVIKK